MIEFINNLYIQIQNIKKEKLEKEYFRLMENYNIDILNFLFFKVHNIIFNDDKYNQIKTRIHQEKFKKELNKLYNNQCILSKVSVCEACHIIPFCISEYGDKYDKYNGLLLKADLHVLFDEYKFSINPETFTVEFDKNFFNNQNDFNEYNKYNNLKVNLENNKTLINNLSEHYNTFLNKNQ